MNTNRTATTADAFEARLSEGLDRLASSTPTSEPGTFDPNRWQTSIREPMGRRAAPYLVAAAAAVAVTVAGLVAVSGRSDNGPAVSEQPAPPPDEPVPAPATDLREAETTTSAIVDLVRGIPTCGTELPVAIEIPSAPAGPMPGPITFGPTVEGQFAQHWELPAGTVEVRWPADEREVYDLEGIRGDRTVFDQMGVSTPDDGTQAMVAVPNIDPSLSSNGGSTLTMTATSAVTDLQPPCDLLQIRYSDRDGNQATRAYDMTDFNGQVGDDGEPGDSFGVDLNPLITSTGDAADAPDPATTASCAGNDIGTTTAGPPAATPPEALATYLVSDGAAARFIASGYREFKISENEYQHAIIYDDGTLITLFTVNLAGEEWAVSHVTSVGC